MDTGSLKVRITLDRNMGQPSMSHKESAVKQITENCPNTRSDYLAGSNSGERDGSVIGRVGATGSLGVSWMGCSSGITLCRRLGSPMSAIERSLHKSSL
jgi:hypothetical protein